MRRRTRPLSPSSLTARGLLPLPNKWTFGGVTGLAVDNDDLIWVLHRPNDLNETENFAALDPPQAECCVKAPAVLAFDRQGT